MVNSYVKTNEKLERDIENKDQENTNLKLIIEQVLYIYSAVHLIQTPGDLPNLFWLWICL